MKRGRQVPHVPACSMAAKGVELAWIPVPMVEAMAVNCSSQLAREQRRRPAYVTCVAWHGYGHTVIAVGQS
jgi:hypothetical protein